MTEVTVDQLIPGGVKPSDHVHRVTNDGTCSRCRKDAMRGDAVPIMFWTQGGRDMLIYCDDCLEARI